MIPVEAGIAGVQAFIALRSAEPYVSPQEYVEAILLAAGPHLKANAWLEGRNSQPERFAPNPYWTTK